VLQPQTEQEILPYHQNHLHNATREEHAESCLGELPLKLAIRLNPFGEVLLESATFVTAWIYGDKRSIS